MTYTSLLTSFHLYVNPMHLHECVSSYILWEASSYCNHLSTLITHTIHSRVTRCVIIHMLIVTLVPPWIYMKFNVLTIMFLFTWIFLDSLMFCHRKSYLDLKLNFASTGIRLYYLKCTVREKAWLQKLFFFVFCPIFFDESIDINYGLFRNTCTNCVDFYQTVRDLSTILHKMFNTF